MAATILKEHFKRNRDLLLKMYEFHSTARHSDILGRLRESVVVEFFHRNLPSQMLVRSGEIVDRKNNVSGQIDIIIQSFHSPKIQLHDNLNLALADTVIAVTEVKSNLTTGSWTKNNHLKNALDNFRKVKILVRDVPYKGMQSPCHEKMKQTPCILFAFQGPKSDTLKRKLFEYGSTFNVPEEEYMPDMIVVLDRGYIVHKNNGWVVAKKGKERLKIIDSGDACLTTLFVFVCKLVEVWNKENLGMTRFNSYFGV